MTGFIVSVFPFRNRVSSKEAFEGLELGEGKLSRPVLRGLGGRKAARLLGTKLDSGPRGRPRADFLGAGRRLARDQATLFRWHRAVNSTHAGGVRASPYLHCSPTQY